MAAPGGGGGDGGPVTAIVSTMGVESGGDGGTRTPVEKSAGDVPPEMRLFSLSFFLTRTKILHFPTFSK